MEWTEVCEYDKPEKADADQAFLDGAGLTEPLKQGDLIPQVGDTHDLGQWFQQQVGSIATTGPCIPDLTINVPAPISRSVTVPLSQACKIVQLLRALVLIGAGISAARIYMGAFN